MASSTIARAAQAAPRVVAVSKKYTVQSTGIWERIRRLLAVDPSRSNGIPLNPQFRNPPPGSNPPHSFVDPVTLPAADIAENPYWKRDSRRGYARMSAVTQGDVVGLLSVGSKEAPKGELVGEEGRMELVRVKEVGELGLGRFLLGGKEEGKEALRVWGKDGLPPLPSGASLVRGRDKYDLTEENAYPEEYPCRTFQ